MSCCFTSKNRTVNGKSNKKSKNGPKVPSYYNYNSKKYHKLCDTESIPNRNDDHDLLLDSEIEPLMLALDNEHNSEEILIENQNEPIEPEPNYYSDDKFGDIYTKGSVIKRLTKESVINKPLFSKDENGNNTVKISDINQKSSGDCWLLSVLGSISVVNPKLILDTVKEEDNNQVSITFKNPKKRIIVDRSIFKDDKGNDIMSTSKDGSICIQIIEKATAILKDKEYKDKNKVETNKAVNVESPAIVKDKQHKDKGEEPINYGRINSREPEEAFELFYNERVNIYGIFKIKEKKYFDRIYTNYYNHEQLNIYKEIKDALKHNKPVVYGITGLAGPPSDIAGINKEPIKAGLAAKHAYSVVGVGNQDGRLFIKIRNPWGNMGVKYMHNGEKYIPVGDETNNDGESELDLNYMFATNGRVYIAKYDSEDSFCNDEDIEESYPGSECRKQN